MAVKPLVGALVDAASVAIAGMPDAEGDHRPGQAAIGLRQAKDKAERGIRRPGRSQWHVELAAPWNLGPIGAVRLAALPGERCPASLDFPARFLRLDPSR